MDSQFVEDFARTLERFEAWWAGDMLDRPVVVLQRRREKPRWPLRDIPARETIDDPSRYYLDPQLAVDQIENELAMTDYYGDAVPRWRRGVNTPYLATFCGAEIFFPRDTTTVWTEPFIRDWKTAPTPKFDTDTELFRRITAVSDALTDNARGRYLLAVPDPIDAVTTMSMMRGAGDLCLDLMDDLDSVLVYRDRLVDVWIESYRWWFEYDAARGVEANANWMGALSRRRVGILQCDFSYMIGPEMFRVLVAPELQREGAFLADAVYHWDGKGQVVHLPALAEIEEITAIQWVFGSGQPTISQNPEPPLAAQKAGLSVVLNVFADELPFLFEHFRPQGALLGVGFREGQNPTDEDCRDVLRRVERWAASKA